MASPRLQRPQSRWAHTACWACCWAVCCGPFSPGSTAGLQRKLISAVFKVRKTLNTNTVSVAMSRKTDGQFTYENRCTSVVHLTFSSLDGGCKCKRIRLGAHLRYKVM